ncbi:hypothetical protein HDV05_002420, partial [Chytridiales sp. JEL 0842]
MADEYDDYDDEVLQTGPLRSEAELVAGINARANDVRNFLTRGDIARAVSRALEEPPAGRDPQHLKDRNVQVVVDALSAAKASDIPSLVKALPPAQLDVLMKFIYRGMASPELYNPSILLAWHEK